MIDADGNEVTYQYNTDSKIQFVTDQAGNTTEIELDNDGTPFEKSRPKAW